MRTYNSMYLVEDDFKWLKDKLLICIMPVYRRKDEKIRVHILFCVVGLVLVRYTAWKLRDLKLTPRQLFEELERIRVAPVQENGTKETTFVVDYITQVPSRIFSRLGLDRFIIK